MESARRSGRVVLPALAAGIVVCEPGPADGDTDGDHKYTWDYRNRLLKVEEKQSGSWNTITECKYDARGRRVLKVVTNKGGLNGTTRYVWGGASDWQCLEERASDGDLVARYTYAPGYVDAVAVQERDLNSDDDFADSSEVVYYHANTLHSVLALSASDESVIERYRYDAYGAVTVLDSDGSADADGLSDVESPYTFTGRRLDSASGLMQYRHRYYDPGLGRFASRDPVGYVDEYGLYVFMGGRPGHSLDPRGLQAQPEDYMHDTLGLRDWSHTATIHGPSQYLPPPSGEGSWQAHAARNAAVKEFIIHVDVWEKERNKRDPDDIVAITSIPDRQGRAHVMRRATISCEEQSRLCIKRCLRGFRDCANRGALICQTALAMKNYPAFAVCAVLYTVTCLTQVLDCAVYCDTKYANCLDPSKPNPGFWWRFRNMTGSCFDNPWYDQYGNQEWWSDGFWGGTNPTHPDRDREGQPIPSS